MSLGDTSSLCPSLTQLSSLIFLLLQQFTTVVIFQIVTCNCLQQAPAFSYLVLDGMLISLTPCLAVLFSTSWCLVRLEGFDICCLIRVEL